MTALQQPELAQSFFTTKTGTAVLHKWPKCRLTVKAVPILQQSNWMFQVYWGGKRLHQSTVSRCFPKDKATLVKVIHERCAVLGVSARA